MAKKFYMLISKLDMGLYIIDYDVCLTSKAVNRDLM